MPIANPDAGSAALIIFDFDGTLVDSHGAIIDAMRRAFTDQGLPAPTDEAIRSVIGLSLPKAVAKLAPPEHLQQAICQAYSRHYLAAEKQTRLYPDVVETLCELRRRGYWLGIATGKSRPGLMRALALFGITDWFAVLRTADCCPSKPHPAMVLESMQELGVPPERTWVVGDAIVDIQMAQAAGVAALGVCFGTRMHEALRAAGAQDVVDAFAALLQYFPPLPDARTTATMAARR